MYFSQYMNYPHDYGFPFYQWPHTYSYTSSAATSDYGGGSRPESVIEGPSSRGSSNQVCSEIADLTSELSFSKRSEPPPEAPEERSTPLSFTRPHVCAKFFSCRGLIGIVTPKQPLDGEVASIQNVPVEDISDIPLHKRLSGPLVRGKTHC